MAPNESSASERRRPRGGTRIGGEHTETPVRDYVCAVLGLFVTIAGVAVLYPALLAVTHPLRYLATVALVCLALVVWLLVWTLLETAWEWRSRRGTSH